MTHQDEIDKIRDKLTTARGRLLAAVDGLEEYAWEWCPPNGSWSVRLTLAHVGSAQWSHLEVARLLLEGQPVNIVDFDLDSWNAAQVAQRAEWPVADVLTDLASGHQVALAFLDSLAPSELAIAGLHPALGEVSVGQVLRVIALHDNLHRRDIQRLLRDMGQQ